MSKTQVQVKLNQTPSEQIVAQAVQEVVIKDSMGRDLKLTKPGVLAHFRLVELVGESAKNQVYMSMVNPLIYVSEYAGSSVEMPTTKLELEALIQLLGDDTVTVIKGVNEAFGKPDPEKDRAALKKSPQPGQ